MRQIDDRNEIDREVVYVQTPTQTNREDGLRDLALLIRRYTTGVIITAGIVFLLGGYMTVTQIRMFEATATISVSQQKNQAFGVQSPLFMSDNTQRYYDSLITRVRGNNEFIRKIICDKSLYLNTDFVADTRTPFKKIISFVPNVFIGAITKLENLLGSNEKKQHYEGKKIVECEQQQYVGVYNALLTVEPRENSDFVDVIFRTPNPQLSFDLAHDHVTRFLKEATTVRLSVDYETRNFIDRKITSVKNDLERKSRDLADARREFGDLTTAEGDPVQLGRISQLEARLGAIKGTVIELSSILHAFKNTINTTPLLSDTDQTLQFLRQQLAINEAEESTARGIYGKDNPQLAIIVQNVRDVKARVRVRTEELHQAIKQKYESVKREEEKLHSMINQEKEKIINANASSGANLALLDMEVKALADVYARLQLVSATSGIETGIPDRSLQMFNDPEVPLSHILPNAPRNFVMTGVAMVICIGIFLYIRVSFDRTIKTEADLGEIDLRIITRIPYSYMKKIPNHIRIDNTYFAGRDDDTHLTGISMYRPNYYGENQFIGNIRTIRTYMLQLQRDNCLPRFIFVTSGSAGDGKTSIVSWLALELARSVDYPVLVLDYDVWRGTLHEEFNLDDAKGIKNILSSHNSIDNEFMSCVQRYRISRADEEEKFLYVLPSGYGNAYDLETSKRNTELFKHICSCNVFGCVIVDTGPIGIVPGMQDVIHSATIVDTVGVVIVVRPENSRSDQFARVMERLSMTRVNILGLVLNGTRENTILDSYQYGSYK